LANTIAVVGASSDFSMWTIAAAAKSASLPGEAYITIATALLMDILVLFMSILAWAAANQMIAALALVFAVFGFYLATSAYVKLRSTVGTVATASLIFSVIGVGAAAADVATA
jgi:hypothetical protein